MKIKLNDKDYPLLNFFLIILAGLVSTSIIIPYLLLWILLGEQPQL